MRNGWVADSWEDAATTFGEHAAEELRFYFRQGIFVHPDFPSESSITPKAIAPHQIFGSPQPCVERLEQYHEEFKVDYFTIRLRMPRGPSLKETAEQILRFGEEVVQPIHKKYPPLAHAAIPQGCRW
jgi:alkanesulfonate monooxygenase SsuD/methylene tetrahydromethanopterin reductase-like flavin-dependent oxidoreductase (luciferase family)